MYKFMLCGGINTKMTIPTCSPMLMFWTLTAKFWAIQSQMFDELMFRNSLVIDSAYENPCAIWIILIVIGFKSFQNRATVYVVLCLVHTNGECRALNRRAKRRHFCSLFQKYLDLLRSGKLWYALIRIGWRFEDKIFPDMLRFLPLWSRFDQALLRLKSRFDKLYYASLLFDAIMTL